MIIIFSFSSLESIGLTRKIITIYTHDEAWGAYFATLHWCLGIDTSTFNDLSEGRRYIKYVQFCSYILIFASIQPLRYRWENYGGAGLSIAVGTITLIATLYLTYLYDDLSRDIFRITMLLGFILWAICAGVCTFYGPFLTRSE